MGLSLDAASYSERSRGGAVTERGGANNYGGKVGVWVRVAWEKDVSKNKCQAQFLLWPELLFSLVEAFSELQ